MNAPLAIVAVIAVLVALGGLVYGLTAKSHPRRSLGLWMLRVGMSVAGLALISSSMVGGKSSDALYGFLLLVFGTGVTGISSRSSSPD